MFVFSSSSSSEQSAFLFLLIFGLYSLYFCCQSRSDLSMFLIQYVTKKTHTRKRLYCHINSSTSYCKYFTLYIYKLLYHKTLYQIHTVHSLKALYINQKHIRLISSFYCFLYCFVFHVFVFPLSLFLRFVFPFILISVTTINKMLYLAHFLQQRASLLCCCCRCCFFTLFFSLNKTTIQRALHFSFSNCFNFCLLLLILIDTRVLT